MGKGSSRRKGVGYTDNYDEVFMKDKVYIVETSDEIFWSKRKMDVTHQHVKYLYRDKARYKQMDEDKFTKYIENTNKKAIKLQGDT